MDENDFWSLPYFCDVSVGADLASPWNPDSDAQTRTQAQMGSPPLSGPAYGSLARALAARSTHGAGPMTTRSQNVENMMQEPAQDNALFYVGNTAVTPVIAAVAAGGIALLLSLRK